MTQFDIGDGLSIPARNQTEARKTLTRMGKLVQAISSLETVLLTIRLPNESGMTLALSPSVTDRGVSVLERCNLITGKSRHLPGYRIDWKHGVTGLTHIFDLADDISTLKERYDHKVKNLICDQATSLLRETLTLQISQVSEKEDTPQKCLEKIVLKLSRPIITRILAATENYLTAEEFAREASQHITSYLAHHIRMTYAKKGNVPAPRTPAEEECIIPAHIVHETDSKLHKIIVDQIIHIRIASNNGREIARILPIPLNNNDIPWMILRTGQSIGATLMPGTDEQTIEDTVNLVLELRDLARDIPIYTNPKTVDEIVRIAKKTADNGRWMLGAAHKTTIAELSATN